MARKFHIVMIGTGYVGLVAGSCFAEWGHKVTAVDIDADKIHNLNKGRIPIHEPDLAHLVRRNVKAGRLTFTTDLARYINPCDVVFLAVGTPQGKADGEADLSFIYQATRNVLESITEDTVLVTKSTVPVGTGDRIETMARQLRPDRNIPVVSNPEFMREGSAVRDFLEADRVIIGADDPAASSILRKIYKPLADKGAPIVQTGRHSAELIKYAINAFLATKLTFINEMADLCEQVGADIADISQGMGLDKRISRHFLDAGPGYGGSCLPKDTMALVTMAQEYGVSLKLVEQTVMINSARKRQMAMRVKQALNNEPDGKIVAVLGLTFKPDTDDMREAPAIPLINTLLRSGAVIHAYDPVGIKQAKKLFPDLNYFDDPYICARNADAVVLMTEWEELTRLDLAKLAAVVRERQLIDLRRIYTPGEAAGYGFNIHSVGSPEMAPHHQDAANIAKFEDYNANPAFIRNGAA